jgi:hypothetical protein
MASKPYTLLVVVFIGILLSSACAQARQSPPSDGADDGQQGTREHSHTANQEPTVRQKERQILTGIITDKGKGSHLFADKPGSWILVEEDPNANCRQRGPLKPGCDKMYFDITLKTSVFRQQGNDRKAEASAADLKEGLRVAADYTGYDVAESYPSQTFARTVLILDHH